MKPKATKTKKPATVSLARLRKLLCPVTTAGARLSNVAHNMKQHDDLADDLRELLSGCQQEWDDAIRGVLKRWRI